MAEQKATVDTDEKPMHHAFVVFGKHHNYLSHSAMFKTPSHAYQVIQEIYIESSSDRDLLVSIRESEPHTLIMALSQAEQVLFALISDKMELDLYRHDLEESNKFATVTAVPGRLLFYNPLNQFSPQYPHDLTYFMFGRGGEIFMSHLITKHPNFHHEVTVTPVMPLIGVTDDELERGFRVTLPSLRDGFSNTDPIPVQSEDSWVVGVPSGHDNPMLISRRDRFTYKALNGDP